MTNTYKTPKLIAGSVLALAIPLLSNNQVVQAQNLNKEQANILVFIADDAGMDFGCYGYKGAHTPNIDALADNGLLIERAFLTAPQCSPSRTSMLSGKFAHTIATEDLHDGINNDSTKIVPYYLQQKGYYTGFMLKGHFGKAAQKQFNWYDNGFWPDYIKGLWNDKAVGNFTQFLDSADQSPFFLWVAFVDPHRPYLDSANAAPAVNKAEDVAVPPYLIDNQETRKDLAAYYDEITRMDDHIGKMLTELDKRGLRENTLIVFLSDNGKPFPRAKGTLYDAGIQTPLIFSWRGQIEPGVRYTQGMVSTIDLAPTFLDVAGVSVPKDMYGQSIRPLFKDQTLPGRDYIFAERNWHGTDEHIRCIRTDDYKLIVNSYIHLPHGTPSDLSTSPSWYALKAAQRAGELTAAQSRLFECPRPRVEIYDLKADPYELLNLADRPDYLQAGKQLLKVMAEWQKATSDHPCYQRRKPDYVDRVTGMPLPRHGHVDFIEK